LNATQLKEAFKYSAVIARICRKAFGSSPDALKRAWGVALLNQAGTKLLQSERFKDSGAAVSWKTFMAIVASGSQGKAQCS
jgi:hypothetical protein